MVTNFIAPPKTGEMIPYYKLIECCAIYQKLLEGAAIQTAQTDDRATLDLIGQQISHTLWFLDHLDSFGPIVKEFDSSCLPPPWHGCRTKKEITEHNLAFWDVVAVREEFPIEELFYKAPLTAVPDRNG